MFRTLRHWVVLNGLFVPCSYAWPQRDMLEPAGFLCTSCPHLMVPLTGGEKGRPVQGRRCPRNCKYPSCSAPAVFGVATGSFRTREGSGTVLCASSWLVQARYKPGDLPSQVCKAVPVGMVAFWRCLLAGCPAGTDAPGGAFSLPYAWQRLVVTAPCLPQPHVVEKRPVGKTHDRRTLFAFLFCSFSTGGATRAACLRYVQAGRACHGLPAG